MTAGSPTAVFYVSVIFTGKYVFRTSIPLTQMLTSSEIEQIHKKKISYVRVTLPYLIFLVKPKFLSFSVEVFKNTGFNTLMIILDKILRQMLNIWP